jgi:hypothetical protein
MRVTQCLIWKGEKFLRHDCILTNTVIQSKRTLLRIIEEGKLRKWVVGLRKIEEMGCGRSAGGFQRTKKREKNSS